MSRRSRALHLVLPLAAAALVAGAGLYVDGAPAGHTGGFGEPTCATCHVPGSTGSLDSIELDVPAGWRPGEVYRIAVTVREPALGRAGFQLSARYRDGTQAGTLEPAGPRVRLARADGVTYASHSEEGAEPSAPGVATWDVFWTAPCATRPVVFDVAANAANDDDSPFGDRVGAIRRTAAARGATTATRR